MKNKKPGGIQIGTKTMIYKLFDIQRNSFVDGPGIRTTVFFRGCNLRCEWCHNPESQSGEKTLFYYADKCKKCGKCGEICRKKAIRYGIFQQKLCDFCGDCAVFCPENALNLCGKDYKIEELFDLLIKDKEYYDLSGGGVTLSGGECMLYPQQVAEISKLLKEAGISVAVDTAGNVPWKNFVEVLPFVDLFLYDVKLADQEKHKKYTGVSNELILQNLGSILHAGKKVIVRIPIIPGVNDTVDEMRRIKKIIERNAPHLPQKIELLPYHRLGENKYNALRLPPHVFSVPSAEKMKELSEIFGD